MRACSWVMVGKAKIGNIEWLKCFARYFIIVKLKKKKKRKRNDSLHFIKSKGKKKKKINFSLFYMNLLLDSET